MALIDVVIGDSEEAISQVGVPADVELRGVTVAASVAGLRLKSGDEGCEALVADPEEVPEFVQQRLAYFGGAIGSLVHPEDGSTLSDQF